MSDTFVFSPGVKRMLQEMIDGAERVQHRTIWWHGLATLNDKTDEAIVFMTFSGEAARAAHAALQAAGVLCEEKYGTLAADGSGQIVLTEPS